MSSNLIFRVYSYIYKLIMAQFDFYAVTTQIGLVLVIFFFFYIFVTKNFLVQIKRQEYILNYITTYKNSTYKFLKINALSLNTNTK